MESAHTFALTEVESDVDSIESMPKPLEVAEDWLSNNVNNQTKRSRKYIMFQK